LRQRPGIVAVYLLVVAALVARVDMACLPHWTAPLMLAATAFWCAAFTGFVIIYGPMLTQEAEVG
jgi:uncharacterized protein involved in response to NO